MALHNIIHHVIMEHDNIDSFRKENKCGITDSKQIIIKEEKFDEYDSVEDNFELLTNIKSEREGEELLGINQESTIAKSYDIYIEQSQIYVKREDIDTKHEEIHLKYENINTDDEKDAENKIMLNSLNLNSYVKETKVETEVRDYDEAGSSSFEFVDVTAVSQDGEFQCNYCHRSFLTNQFCEQHKTRCNENSQQLTELSRKVESSKPEKDMLEKRGSLKVHTKINTGKKRYKCTECEKAFSRSGHLKDHMRVHTGEKPHKCTECGKAFSRTCDLKVHIRIHTGEKPHKCTLCEKAFSQAGPLKDHMTIHSGEKQFKCTQCGKAFSRPVDLKVHMRVHTGEKPYKCTQCDKAFTQTGSLRDHMTIHTGEKPYECTLCEKAFSRAFDLKVHTRIHTGEKPYKCTHCDKAFSQAGSLKDHLRIHTGDKSHTRMGPLARSILASPNLDNF